MSQSYKSYGFYDINNSDNEDNSKNPGKPSRLAQKQEKKKNERMRKQKDLDSDSEEEEKITTKGPTQDIESEFAPKNVKKLKQEVQSNKKKDQDLNKKIEVTQDVSSNIVPKPQDQNLNANLQNKGINSINQDSLNQNTLKKGGLTPPMSVSQNSSFQTVALGPSSDGKMNIESQTIDESKLEGNNNSLLGNSNNESFTEMVSGQEFSGNIMPSNLLNENILNANFQTPYARKSNSNAEPTGTESSVTQLNESLISQTVSTIPQEETNLNDSILNTQDKSGRETRENREGAQIAKKKSGKYKEESSSSESSPSPKKVSSPKAQPKTLPSAENRQRSKLSSHLRSIRESMKNQDQNELDTESGAVGIPSGKPKFFVDTTPLGIFEEEGENKKLVPQVQTTEMEIEDRQYKIIGHERAFRTQEKNLLEKLNKFFVEKEEDKKEEDKLETKEDEEFKEINDEFNFESRYFMYNPTKVCNRCKKAGHFERWCPEDVTIRCLFCVGHHKTDDCTQVVCFQCYGVGHRARDCDAPGSLVCFRCGKRGHKSSQCGMIVLKDVTLSKEKRDESGDIKCIKCGRYGHAKCGRENSGGKRGKDTDTLYKEKEKNFEREREETNLKILSRARDIERFEFEGSLSNESFEDLNNFEPASRSNYAKKSRREREEEVLREIKKEKKERHREKEKKRNDKDKYSRDKYSQKKKSKRYSNN